MIGRRTVLTDRELQQIIEAAVRNFARSVECWAAPRGWPGKCWRVLVELGPCTYREIAARLRLPPWGAYSLLRQLVVNRWARTEGREQGRSRDGRRGARLFVAVTAERPLVARARSRLYCRAARARELVERRPRLAERFELGRLGWVRQTERNSRIVRARLAGQPMSAIAAAHGLTGERVRQIVARAIM